MNRGWIVLVSTVAPWILIFGWLAIYTFVPVVLVTRVDGWRVNANTHELQVDVEQLKLLPCTVIAGSLEAFSKTDGQPWYAIPIAENPTTAVTNHVGSRFFRQWMVKIPDDNEPPDRLLVRVRHICSGGTVTTDVGPLDVPPYVPVVIR